jgi:hypothetical protein
MHQANRTERITWKLSDELGTLLFQHRHLTPEVLQLTVDASQSGSGSPFPVVLVVIGAVHELVDLAPQEPEPGVPMDHADAVAELAGVVPEPRLSNAQNNPDDVRPSYRGR